MQKVKSKKLNITCKKGFISSPEFPTINIMNGVLDQVENFSEHLDEVSHDIHEILKSNAHPSQKNAIIKDELHLLKNNLVEAISLTLEQQISEILSRTQR